MAKHKKQVKTKIDRFTRLDSAAAEMRIFGHNKPTQVETVEEFLARGGGIKELDNVGNVKNVRKKITLIKRKK